MRVSSLNPAMPYSSVRLVRAYRTSTIFLRMICNRIEGLDDRFHETGDHELVSCSRIPCLQLGNKERRNGKMAADDRTGDD
jgi:hypothetical protein